MKGKVDSHHQILSSWALVAHKLKRWILSRPRLVRSLLVIVLGIGLYHGLAWGWKTFWPETSLLPEWGHYIRAFANPSSTLISYKDRTNVLILGIGGEQHDGGELTDSIMFASYDHAQNRVTLLPIPRDIWIHSLKAKINHAYMIGEEKQPGSGFTLLKAAVGEVINQPVHYVVMLDFNGFARFIDALGGIEVDVKRAFTDERYPIPGMENAEPESLRYETITFSEGVQTMDGATALKFARSRNAEGEEGSDLARSERQKQVIAGVRNKLLQTNVIFNQQKLQELKHVVEGSLVTDISDETFVAFARLGSKVVSLETESVTLPVFLANDKGTTSEEDSSLFFNPPISETYGFQWVLVPVGNNGFAPIHRFVACALTQVENCNGAETEVVEGI